MPEDSHYTVPADGKKISSKNDQLIIPKNPIIGNVAVFGKSSNVLPQAYKKIAITSNITNIRM